ncbi:MAG TPA: Gfo/Idh/MocA family oxidoreductase, partial [Acidimicrobiales bacterium]|nr:Gfo/Idh/MocA family oxidoreductase [Acidimicrobiales bacterium]
GIDAVTIATPPDHHAALTLEAIAAGAHVLCEKPFALDAREAEAMVSAAAEGRVVGLVGHEFRFTPSQALVARLLGAGAIGAPRLAVLTQLIGLVADPSAPMPAWWFDPARGGGWLGASGSHAIDRVRHWFGEVTAVDGLVQRRRDLADDTFAARLRTADGCVVEVVQSAAAWGPATGMTRIVGPDGSLWLDGEQVMLADAAHPDGLVVDVPQDLRLADVASPPTPDSPSHRFTHLELGPYTRLCQRFAAAIEGGDAGGAATFADGLAVQRVLDAIRAG